MTNESKFETLAISSLPLGNGYRCTINLEHHVDVPLPYVNAHVRDFLSASAAFATKMRDAIDPPPKEESQAPDNAAKVHNNVEPFAWAIEVSEGVWSFTHMPHVARMWPQAEVIPLYRSPTLTDAEREAIEWAAREADQWEDDEPVPHQHAATLRGVLERLGGAE